MEMFKDLPVIFFENEAEWTAWLEDHFSQQSGIWVKFAKKASGITSLSYASAVDVALCYGWIDGQAQSLDENYYLQRFTPRRAKSIWSKRNIEKIAALTAAGRMKASGLAQVEAAKLDGRWEQAYDAPSAMTTPADFQALLDAHPTAKQNFENLNHTNTYAILWQIQTAKRPETREIRMKKLLAMLQKGDKPH